jgi:hypothetical protein
MLISEQIGAVLEQLPEERQRLILEVAKNMLPSDDILTDEDIADIKQARAEFARGEYVRYEDINWD